MPARLAGIRSQQRTQAGEAVAGQTADADQLPQPLFELTAQQTAASGDLIEEAGVDACRFIFLMKTTNAQMEFNLDLIGNQSKENPVFYFQYGHARCAAILRKAIEEGQPFLGVDALSDEQLAVLILPEEKLLLKKLSQLPEVVAAAASSSEPHRVLYFCQELIAEFHSYYSKYKRTERVISDDKTKTQGRVALVAVLKQTLKNAFLILGVDDPEVMNRVIDDDEADPDESPGV